ncbi:helix-turn-helix domain-containing protein [Sporolactobacillus pectinivorans]|uniref:helix-turn-helix domain-containing protein n=1 Tax=Sporolactobacillus pectinivorans TaxID=1591408 RepID=UPI001EFE3301|nr:AraC family transcriptional regulator [Sporolactobacillus pectinivorans]
MRDICFNITSYGSEQNRLNETHVKLLIPIQGNVGVITTGSRKIVTGTQICLLPLRYAYSVCSSGSNESLVVEMPEGYAHLFIKDIMNEREGLVREIDEILQPVKALLIHEIMHQNHEEAVLLLNYLLHKMAEQPESQSLRFIRRHYAEKIDIKALAEMEHYTPSYYCGWFKRKMQMTPLEYIHFLRIHRAKELLRDSKLSVLTISYQLGYEYNASFTKMFKKYEQLSPSEYRAALQE